MILSAASLASNLTAPIPAFVPTTALAAGILPYSIANILMMVVNFYVLIIIVWCILSWFGNLNGKGIINDVYRALDTIVAPFINLFRRFIPPMGGMDFSPIIAILLLQLVARFIL
jgi:YggT family protein